MKKYKDFRKSGRFVLSTQAAMARREGTASAAKLLIID